MEKQKEKNKNIKLVNILEWYCITNDKITVTEVCQILSMCLYQGAQLPFPVKYFTSYNSSFYNIWFPMFLNDPAVSGGIYTL